MGGTTVCFANGSVWCYMVLYGAMVRFDMARKRTKCDLVDMDEKGWPRNMLIFDMLIFDMLMVGGPDVWMGDECSS